MSITGAELIGQRLVGRMPEPSLVELWIKCTSRIVKYGFAIEYRDLEPPRTGIFDERLLHTHPRLGVEFPVHVCAQQLVVEFETFAHFAALTR